MGALLGSTEDGALIKYRTPSGETDVIRGANAGDETETDVNSISCVSAIVTRSVSELRSLASDSRVLCVNTGPIDQLQGLTDPTIVFSGDLFSDYRRVTKGMDSDVFEELGALSGKLPSNYSLTGNYPNPFNPTTLIRYELSEESPVRLIIYNVTGQEIKLLIDEEQSAGYKSVTWDGRDNDGRAVATGIYFYRLNVRGFSQTKKMVLLK